MALVGEGDSPRSLSNVFIDLSVSLSLSPSVSLSLSSHIHSPSLSPILSIPVLLYPSYSSFFLRPVVVFAQSVVNMTFRRSAVVVFRVMTSIFNKFSTLPSGVLVLLPPSTSIDMVASRVSNFCPGVPAKMTRPAVVSAVRAIVPQWRLWTLSRRPRHTPQRTVSTIDAW